MSGFPLRGTIWIKRTDDSVFHQGCVEIRQQDQGRVTKPEICHQLCLVKWMNQVHRLDFRHQRFLDEDVELKIAVERAVLIDDRQSPLAGESEPGFSQLIAQAGFIDAFHQSWAEISMHFGRTTDHAPRELTVWNWFHV